MLLNQVLRIPKVNDKVLIKCFEEMARIVEPHKPAVSLELLGSGILEYDLSDSNKNENLDNLLEKNSELIFRATFKIHEFEFKIYRGGSRESYSPYSDEVSISVIPYSEPGVSSRLSPEQKINLADTALQRLKAYTKYRTAGEFNSHEHEDLASIHESTLSRLEKLNEELLVKTHDYRQLLDAEFKDKIIKFEEHKLDQLKNLDSQKSLAEEQISKKEEEFEKRIKELDDKSNTHARRQIRKDILKEIKERQTTFNLTHGTNKLRTPVAKAILALIWALTLLTGFSFFELFQALRGSTGIVLWISLFKQITLAFGLVLSILYYIRWQNRWFEQHSQAEFKLKQLELDMERASWLVETSLEWNDVKGNSLPKELLTSLSRNLFTETKEQSEDIAHPADQLASALMGSASLVRLRAGDSQIDIDPKKLKKSRKQIESDDLS